jgi:CO dehydrogenase maturation factor
MLVVVEPGQRAVETAASVRRMAQEVSIRRFAVIGNKITGDEDRAFLEAAFSKEDYLGSLPFSETIRRADREGLPLVDIADDSLMSQFRELWGKVKDRSSRQ